MRMMPILAVVVALGLSLTVLAGLGISDEFGDDGDVGLSEEINDTANQDEAVSPDEGDDGGFFSFLVDGLATIRNMMGIVVYLPSTLESLGAPAVLARAIGHGSQLVIAIGMVQVALQYDIR